MDPTEAAAQLKSFEELYKAGFISLEEFNARKQELQGIASGVAAPVDDLTEDMKIKFEAFGGPFKNATDSIKFNFENSLDAANALRTIAGVTGDCVVITFGCKASADVSELEILRDTLEVFCHQVLQETPELPFCQPKVEVVNSSKNLQIVLEIAPDVSAIASGIIEAVARKLHVEINFDKDAYAIQLFLDAQASRNMIELAQDMANLPPAIGQIAQLFDCSESTFRFKSIRHLTENKLIQDDLPADFRPAVQALVSGQGFDATVGFFLAAIFRELGDKMDEIKPYLALGFNNVESIESVQAVFGNTSVFRLLFQLPGFVPMCHQQFILSESQ